MGKLYDIKGYKIKVKTKKCENTSFSVDMHPKIDESDLLDEEGHKAYKHLVGILQQLCTIGMADTQFSVFSLSPACSHKGQLKAVEKVFGYFKDLPERWIKVDHWGLKGLPMLPTPDLSFKEQHPDALEELGQQFPIPFGPLIQSSIFFHSDLAHDQKAKRSCTGIIMCVGSAPVSWLSKRQSSIQISVYGAECMVGKPACKKAISVIYMLRFLGF